MDEPWLRRDYSGFWHLPAPPPPARWPWVAMGLLAGVVVLAVASAHSQTPGHDDMRALVCVIDRKDGRPCKKEDAEALARAAARDADRAARVEALRQKIEKLRAEGVFHPQP